MKIVDTPRLYAALWRPEDHEQLYPIASDPEVVRHIGDGQPYSRDKTRTWVAGQIVKQRDQGFCRYPLFRKTDDALVGWCGLDRFGTTGDVELGYWLARACWGQGLATEAAAAVLHHARDTLGLARVISVCRTDHAASRRVMEKIGMRFERETDVRALGIPLDLRVVVYGI